MELLAVNKKTGHVVVALNAIKEGLTLEQMSYLANLWNHENTRSDMFIDHVTDGKNTIETPYNLPLEF